MALVLLGSFFVQVSNMAVKPGTIAKSTHVLHIQLKKAEAHARLGGHELKSQGEMLNGDEGEVSIWGRGWGSWDEKDWDRLVPRWAESLFS